MNAPIQRRLVSTSYLSRWSGRISGAFLLASWLGFVIAEQFHDLSTFSGISYLQAGALIIVFAGYAIGWRWELTGGLMALFGTAFFFVVHIRALSSLPDLATAWFAAPGVLYLLAWLLGCRFGMTKSAVIARNRRHSEELFLARLRSAKELRRVI